MIYIALYEIVYLIAPIERKRLTTGHVSKGLKLDNMEKKLLLIVFVIDYSRFLCKRPSV